MENEPTEAPVQQRWQETFFGLLFNGLPLVAAGVVGVIGGGILRMAHAPLWLAIIIGLVAFIISGAIFWMAWLDSCGRIFGSALVILFGLGLVFAYHVKENRGHRPQQAVHPSAGTAR